MSRYFGGLPWQFFFREKPSFSTEEGKILVCHFEKSSNSIFEFNLYMDSIEFPTSVNSERVPRERQAIQYRQGSHFFRYDYLLSYFESASVNPLLQDWISTELDKARRTEEQIEPFLTLSFYLGDSFFSASEEGQTSLSERYKKLLRESYIPSEGVREIEEVLNQYPITDPVEAFFQRFIDLGILSRSNGKRPYKLKSGYKAEDFSRKVTEQINLGKVEKVMNVTDYHNFIAQSNGEPYKNPYEFRKKSNI